VDGEEVAKHCADLPNMPKELCTSFVKKKEKKRDK